MGEKSEFLAMLLLMSMYFCPGDNCIPYYLYWWHRDRKLKFLQYGSQTKIKSDENFNSYKKQIVHWGYDLYLVHQTWYIHTSGTHNCHEDRGGLCIIIIDHWHTPEPLWQHKAWCHHLVTGPIRPTAWRTALTPGLIQLHAIRLWITHNNRKPRMGWKMASYSSDLWPSQGTAGEEGTASVICRPRWPAEDNTIQSAGRAGEGCWQAAIGGIGWSENTTTAWVRDIHI